MKKLFLVLAAAFAMVACQTDINEVGVAGGEVDVTFEVGTPTRAYSDGKTATVLQYAVYEDETELTALTRSLKGDNPDTINIRKNVSFKLVTGNTYTVIFWAAAPNAPYTVDFANKEMTVDYTGVKCNDENLDAFYAKYEFTVKGAQTETIELRRPFAQLNIGTSDYTASANAGYEPNQSYVKVTNIYNTLNLWSGAVSGETAVEFAYADIKKDEEFPVTGYEYLAMNYLLVNGKETVDVEFAYNETSTGDAKTRVVGSVPVQRNYRTNIYGQLLTSDVDINVVINPEYVDAQNDCFVVSTDEELAAALNSGKKEIYVYLKESVALDVTNTYIQIGGANTELIVIDGDYTQNTTSRSANAHKLTLATTYWSHLNTLNPDAKLVLKNLDLTSPQTSGTWDSYDVVFKCNVELENVNVLKSMALIGTGKSAKLTNVSITEEHDYYALWISAAGLTVDVKDLTIKAGRGIKIDEQYVAAEDKGLVTLNIEGATFDTEKKAAIVVKSTEGADINASGLDISQVAEDDVFAVWVDEDSKAYADKVSVESTKDGEVVKSVVEGTVKKVATSEEFVAALVDGNYVVLTEDITYTGNYSLKAKNVIIDLNGKSITAPMFYVFSTATIQNGTLNGKMYARTGCNLTLDGMTFSGTISDDLSTEGHLQVQGGCDVYAKGCVFAATTVNGSQTRSLSIEGSSSGTRKFENCDFKFLSWGTGAGKYKKNVYINTMSGTTTVEFVNCKLNGKAPNIIFAAAKSLSSLSMTGCDNTSPTLEINRAKDVVTEAEWAHISSLIANNKFTQVRVFYNATTSEYIKK